MPPDIEQISETQRVVLDTDFMLSVSISGNPDYVKVTGDYIGLSYDYIDGMLMIRGKPPNDEYLSNLIEIDEWVITARNSNGTSMSTINYSVVPKIPEIMLPSSQRIRRNTNYSIDIEITNAPSAIEVRGLLIGLIFTIEDTGIQISGRVSSSDNFTTNSGEFTILASNENNEDNPTQAFLSYTLI